MAEMARRPIASRDTGWARAVASFLASRRVAPNTISVWSVIFAALGGVCAWLARGNPWWLVGTAAGIQARLLCNLFDGMVAVEGGMQTKTGDVYNDMPDRFADMFILVPLGYATNELWGGELGWAAGGLAVFTAYVRMLGGSLGLKQDFVGPMAKQQRMATATIASLATVAESFWHPESYLLAIALGLIAIGSVFNIFRRTLRIMGLLEAR